MQWRAASAKQSTCSQHTFPSGAAQNLRDALSDVIIELYNHRKVGVGRDLKDHQVQTPHNDSNSKGPFLLGTWVWGSLCPHAAFTFDVDIPNLSDSLKQSHLRPAPSLSLAAPTAIPTAFPYSPTSKPNILSILGNWLNLPPWVYRITLGFKENILFSSYTYFSVNEHKQPGREVKSSRRLIFSLIFLKWLCSRISLQ